MTVTAVSMSRRHFRFCLAFSITVVVIWISCFLKTMDKRLLDKSPPNSSLRTREASTRSLHLAVSGLTKSLACITGSNNSSDLNSMIGLSMAAGKLKRILSRWTQPLPDRDNLLRVLITSTLQAIDDARNRVYAANVKHENIHISLSDGIFRTDFWDFELRKKRSTRVNDCDEVYSDVTYVEYMDQTMSNKCLSEVSSPKIEQCHLSNACVRHMIRPAKFKGYSGTHQLFYVIAASRMACEHKAPFLRSITKIGGGKMLQHACAIACKRFPEEHQDLFLEYVLFGSLAGFDEILRDDWFDKILEWQSHDGCFYTSGKGRLGFLEMIHKTAVAVAVFGSYTSLYLSQLL